VPLRGAAADPSSDYETPLGRVAVDAEALQRLEASPDFRDRRALIPARARDRDAVAFLDVARFAAPGADPGRRAARRRIRPVAAAIAPLLDVRTLVVSSDFTIACRFRIRAVHRARARTHRHQTTTPSKRSWTVMRPASGIPGAHRCDDLRPQSARRLLELLPVDWRGSLWAYAMSGAINGDYGAR
jgi:hypothetical protein